MITTDRARRILQINRHSAAFFDYEPAELNGRSFETLIHPSHRDFVANLFARLEVGTAVAHREVLALRKGGVAVTVDVGFSCIDAAGTPVVIAAVTDVSDRIQGETTRQRMVALVESADDAILAKSLDGIIQSWNAAATRLLGFMPEDIVGQSVMRLIPPDRQIEEDMILGKIKNGERVSNFETKRRRSDGTLIDVSLTISPIKDRYGVVVGASKIMRDISERKATLEQLRQLNEQLTLQVESGRRQLLEREALLQEVHHRVKNNLQVIFSLINMQVRGLQDVNVRLALQQCQSRIATMAEIHELLYKANDFTSVPFDKYARELTSRVLQAASDLPLMPTVQFELQELSLPVDSAIPCGLILNELVGNALKHAFPDGRRGSIRIKLERSPPDTIVLAVSDDGVGVTEDFDPAESKSLGLRLVSRLAKQLAGELEIERNGGTTVRVRFVPGIRGALL